MRVKGKVVLQYSLPGIHYNEKYGVSFIVVYFNIFHFVQYFCKLVCYCSNRVVDFFQDWSVLGKSLAGLM